MMLADDSAGRRGIHASYRSPPFKDHQTILKRHLGLVRRFRVPWLHPDLCPFNAGPHWLGGYNEVSTGAWDCVAPVATCDAKYPPTVHVSP